jgi:threonine dehydratase
MTVTINEIRAASEHISHVINHTPVVADATMSTVLGASVFLKAENLQKSGSFKIRGAYNKISKLSDDEKRRGVIAASAGNHAQGVAQAASIVGTRSTIVLPEFAPLTKINATKRLGGEVVLYGKSFDEAVAHSKELCAERGLTYVHAFDDEAIIAGQGSIGLEIAGSLPETNVIVVPIGGGGVMSGIAIAARALLPNVRLIGVQTEAVSSINPSLQAGNPVEAAATPTIADGIAVKRPGELTLPIIKELVDEVVLVSEDEIARGIYHCVQNCKLVVEGAGAAGVAALLSNKVAVRPGETVCAVLCGGNIDANLLARVLEQVLVTEGRYVMMSVLVLDRPGFLAGLLNTVAECGANVIEVFHRRAMWLTPLGHVGIEMLLEVRDEDHTAEVQSKLSEAGYDVVTEKSVHDRS